MLKRLNRELDGEEVELTRGRVTEERHRPQPLAFLQGRAHLAFPGDDATELGPENPLVEDEQAHGGDRLHGRLADAPPEQRPLAKEVARSLAFDHGILARVANHNDGFALGNHEELVTALALADDGGALRHVADPRRLRETLDGGGGQRP